MPAKKKPTAPPRDLLMAAFRELFDARARWDGGDENKDGAYNRAKEAHELLGDFLKTRGGKS